MSKRDYYEILELERSAAEADVKKSFRRMAMKYHPDRNPDSHEAEERFKEVKEAYEVLSDPQKRQAYDQFGHAGVGGGMGGGFGAGGFNFGDIFEDIFADAFGGGRGRQRSYGQAGSDLRYNLSLTLEEAISGKTVKITIPTQVECDACDGKGAKKGTSAITCATCQGIGQVHMQQGFFTVQQTCPTCRGRGQTIKDPCTSCRGAGRKQSEKTLSVKIPAGVDTGDRIRLSGEGEAGMHGGPSGDLYVEVHVAEHDIFKRDGNQLHCDVPISFMMASLGGEIEIPTLAGKVKLQIPHETQTGKLFRVRGKGVKSVRHHTTGDLICRVIVETPVNLTKKQKECLKQFENALAESDVNHSPRTSGWFDVVKKFFKNAQA